MRWPEIASSTSVVWSISKANCSSASARRSGWSQVWLADDVALGHDPAHEVGVALGLAAQLEERGLHAVAGEDVEDLAG